AEVLAARGPLPEGVERTGVAGTRTRRHRAKRRLNPGSQLIHRRNEQPLFRAEVIDEQARAGSHLRRQRPERQVRDAMIEQIVEGPFDEFAAALAHETTVT